MDTISTQPHDHLRQTIIDEIKSLEESTRALRSRRNVLAPISRLPSETLVTIFTLLSASAWDERPAHLKWVRVAHVCRRWREAALNHPRFWSYINVDKLTSAGMVEILARAKMAPLHLEADLRKWVTAKFEPFERQLEAHISHTRHLTISGYNATPLPGLTSSAPTLESLILSHDRIGDTIPDNLLNCTTPNLTSFELKNCNISWKSPLLKGLRNLKLFNISAKARPELEDWLDALNEMPKLESLSLRSATPFAPPAGPLISERSRTITLPSLTHFYIRAFARDCALALAHLLFPTLTWLHVSVRSRDEEGEDVRLVLPYVARNVHVLQDIEPIRSILIAGEQTYTEVYAWSVPGSDVEICDPDTLGRMSRSACLMFAAQGNKWRYGVDSAIFDSLLTLLPVNSISTLTTHNCTRLSKEFWLSHGSRLPLLEQARLISTSVGAFSEMLAEESPPDGPLLPSLTRLILLDVWLVAVRMYHLGDMLMKRVEQGVPLEVLDLGTCTTADRAIQFLSEIVVDVLEPLDAPPMTMEEFFMGMQIGYCYGLEYDDERKSWYYVDDDEMEYGYNLTNNEDEEL